MYRKEALRSRGERAWGQPRRRSRASTLCALLVSLMTTGLAGYLSWAWGSAW